MAPFRMKILFFPELFVHSVTSHRGWVHVGIQSLDTEESTHEWGGNVQVPKRYWIKKTAHKESRQQVTKDNFGSPLVIYIVLTG